MTLMIGPLPCLTCKRSVWWDRVGTDVRLMETKHGRIRSHVCPPTCLAILPNVKEPCARRRGHAGSHRSRYAMDNQNRSRRKFGWNFVERTPENSAPSLTAKAPNHRTIAA